MSIGSEKLREILLDIFGEKTRLFPEYIVGENLRLDFYLPDYKLGFEWHGRQHMEFVEHFHKDKAGFIDSQNRDRRKLELCAEQGIDVVVIWDHEELSTDLIHERIIKAKAEDNTLEKESNLVLSSIKERLSQYRKEQRQKYLASDAHSEILEAARIARKEQYQWRKKQKKQLR